MSESHEWQTQLIRFLISGGLGGREQNRIMTLLGPKVYADRVLHELNSLRAEGKVQKFNLPMKGKGTAVVWRATTEMLTTHVNGSSVSDDASDDDQRE
jgi:hypothetical protein